MTKKVCWYEGLMVMPQHFQLQEEFILHDVKSLSFHKDRNDWGLIDLDINQSELKLGYFKVEEAKGIFSDGTPFYINSENHLSIKITSEDVGKAVILCMPSNREHAIRNKTISKSIASSSIEDSNKMEDIEITTLNLSLKVGKEFILGNECIELAIIKEVHENNNVILDQSFISPCLNINNNKTIINYLNQIENHIQDYIVTYRKNHYLYFFSNDIINKIRFTAIEKFLIKIKYIIKNSFLHPFQLYGLLLDLYIEISNDINLNNISIEYFNHSQLTIVFRSLYEKIIKSLKKIKNDSININKYSKVENNLYLFDLDYSKNFTNIVLSINWLDISDKNEDFLINNIKISNCNDIESLIKYALPGYKFDKINLFQFSASDSNTTYLKIVTTDFNIIKTKQEAIAIYINDNTTINNVEILTF